MAADIVYRLDAETGKAVGGFLRLVDAQKKSEDGMKKNAQAGKGLDRTLGGLKATLGQVAGALGVGFGIAGVIGLVKSGVQEWHRYMKEIAEFSKKTNQEALAFALMQEKGTRAGRLREVAVMAAPFNVGPGEAWAQFQAMQAQTGTYQGGQRASMAAWRLSRMGVPSEEAARAVSIGMGLGLPAEQAARAPYAAGLVSSLSPAEMAQAASQGLPEYGGIGGGPLFGYQVMAQLSQVYKDPGKLGTMTARAATALADEKVWRRRGFKDVGADPLAQLRSLHEAGITTPQQLGKIGFTERRERLAIAALLQDLPGFEARAAEVTGLAGQEGLLGREYAGVEAEMPALALTRQINQLSAEMAYERGMGASSIKALERQRYRKAAALALEEAGLGRWVGEDQEAGPWARFKARALASSHWEQEMRESGDAPPGQPMRWGEAFDWKVRQTLERLADGIEEANRAGTFNRAAAGE